MRPDSTIQWNAYPALALAGCLALGIASAASGSTLAFWTWIGGIVAGLMLALVVPRFGRRRLVTAAPLAHTLTLAILVVGLGGARYAYEQAAPPSHIAHWLDRYAADTTVTLIGRLAEPPTQRSTRVRFLLEAERLITARDTMAATGCIQVTWRPAFRQPVRGVPALLQGDVVQVRGRLRRPPPRRNPADFDAAGYLAQRGIYATLFVGDAADLTRRGHRRTWMDRLVVPMHVYVREHLDRLVPTEAARAVLQALVLGDRSRLEADTRRRFARTGLMHLLAVSGLHVLLVGMVLYGLLRPLLLRLRFGWKAMECTRAGITMALLVLYMLLAGAGASVVRAVVMAGVLIGGSVLQRSAHPLNTLGVAAVVMLLARPAHLFDVGFQLSFAAVAAIVTLHPVLVRWAPETWHTQPFRRSLFMMLTVSLAATLGTMPVLLYHFGQASFAGLLLNLAAIPLTTLTLASGLLALGLGGWLPAGAEVFGAAADLLARGLLATADVGHAVLGWATVQRYVRGAWYVLAMGAALLMLAQWPRPRLRWRLGATSVSLATLGLWTGIVTGAYHPSLDVVFFDVGHGDAALITLPNGRRLLIDAGGRDATGNQGARTLLPHFERYSIRPLDAVLVTHPHSDHLGGLPSLLRGVPIGRVLHNGQDASSALYMEATHLLDSLGVPHRAVGAGDTLALDPTVRMQILAPDTRETDANNASVVLRLIYGRTTFLFTGDAEAEAEQRLEGRYGALLRSHVVKVGHHGSRTSSTRRFVQAVAPDSTDAPMAVVSVGSPRRFGLPDEEVLSQWQAHGATVWITHRQGALWIRSDGHQVRRIAWRSRR